VPVLLKRVRLPLAALYKTGLSPERVKEQMSIEITNSNGVKVAVFGCRCDYQDSLKLVRIVGMMMGGEVHVNETSLEVLDEAGESIGMLFVKEVR
jgi:hypothetical protein